MTSLAALDFLVCLKSDVFVMTHGGNFAKLIIGARRYMGHQLKSIKPDKGLMSKSFGDPYMGWATFVEDVVVTHQTRTGLPEETFPNYDLWENPLTPCMCRAWPHEYLIWSFSLEILFRSFSNRGLCINSWRDWKLLCPQGMKKLQETAHTGCSLGANE